VKIYDLLSGGRNFAPSSWLGCEPLLRKVPELATEGLCGAVRYYDGFTNDARLTMDTIRSAARAGAVVLNYCQFLDATAGQTWGASVRDHLTGQTCRLQARNIVNATGPWADIVAHSAVKLRVTKGIHLVVYRARLPVPEVVVMTEGKRILFAIPWGERTILGTTDTDYTGKPEQVATESADIAYVLDITNRFFPGAKLNPADVLSCWAGLRPLLADAHGKPSDISRSHEIRSPEPGWWDVAGGKLTTYRLMAEQTVDRIVHRLADHKRFAPCRTAVEPLLPPEETRNVSGIIPPPLNPALAEHYCAREWAVHLDDVMLRRSGWHYYEKDADQKAEQVAVWMARLLGWSGGQREAELRRYRELVGRASVPRATTSLA
jgi:glycerol-3-phosphate dehydrogenase